MSVSAKWDDLRVRLLSALALVVIGGVEIWLGGHWFHGLIALACGVMVWELLRMLRGGDKRHAGRDVIGVSILAGVAVFGSAYVSGMMAIAALSVPFVFGLLVLEKDRAIWLAYAPAIFAAGFALNMIRDFAGIPVLLWLLAVVIASDVAGYFAGRLIGGPKFWPRVSPKKTWSGTIAGWIGAGIVGALFIDVVQDPFSGWALVPISALMALAAQMGDIAESAIKRHTGKKDSSTLIPGHGGVLDRFDALIGASLLFLVLSVVL